MLKVNNDVLTKIDQIQKQEKENGDNHCINNALDLALLFNSYDIEIEDVNHVKTIKYCELLDVILDYLKNGYWRVLHDLMTSQYVTPRSGQELSPAQITNNYKKYLEKRNNLFRELKLDPSPNNDKAIFYYWLLKPKGFSDMLKVASCICLIYTYYN